MREKVRWGILGAANIARKNWQAIFNSGNSVVSAVASRDLARAQRFISECQSQVPMAVEPKAFGSYEALLEAEVDAVYIPLPTGVRKEWVIRAAQAGKHVLCEKPCASSAADLQAMIQACREHNVLFMDGVMFMHSARLSKLRETVSAQLGQLKRISSAFSFVGDEAFFAGNIRASAELEPFGCLGDLGWYCLRLALAIADRMPKAVTGRILSQRTPSGRETAVPTEFSGELFFEEGISSGFYCSFLTDTEQWAHISGSKGLIRLSDFVLPFFGSEVEFEVSRPLFRVNGCDFHMEPRSTRVAIPEYSDSEASSQETNLFRNFSAQVLSGKYEPYWAEIALQTQQVMEACLASARQNSAPVSLRAAAGHSV